MSLKSLIQRLLDSRTTPEEAGHSAMPSPTEVSLTPSVTSQEVWGNVCTGIASSDGYIRMDFGATSPEAIGSARSLGAVAFSTPQKTGDIVSVICPVAKGRAYAMYVRNANNITCAFVKLIGSIGGGYQTFKNALLQGGGLCLSHWYSSLQRNSYRTSGSGWLISQQFLFKALLNYLLLQMEKVTHSRCRTRGLSTSEVMEFGLPILEGSISSISDHLRMGIFRSGLTLKKVKNLPTQLGNQISSLLPIFEYTKSRGTIDQMFGGASC